MIQIILIFTTFYLFCVQAELLATWEFNEALNASQVKILPDDSPDVAVTTDSDPVGFNLLRCRVPMSDEPAKYLTNVLFTTPGFVSDTGYWIGFSVLSAKTNGVFLTSGSGTGIAGVTLANLREAAPRLLLSPDGTQFRVQASNAVEAEDIGVPVQRDKWYDVVMFVEASSSQGSLKVFIDDVEVYTKTGLIGISFSQPNFAVGVNTNGDLPALMYFDNIRIFKGPDDEMGKNAVDPKKNKPSSPVGPYCNDGTTACPCRTDPLNPCDRGLVCVRLKEPGYCAQGPVTQSCKSIGSENCPCAAGKSCAKGLLCLSNICRDLDGGDPNAPFSPAQAGNVSLASCPVPTVSPSDWFAALCAALLLIAALFYWLRQLFCAPDLSSGPAKIDEQADHDFLISAQGVQRPQSMWVPNNEIYGALPNDQHQLQAMGGGNAGGGGGRENYHPLPPDPNEFQAMAGGTFTGVGTFTGAPAGPAVGEIYSKVPSAPWGNEARARHMTGVFPVQRPLPELGASGGVTSLLAPDAPVGKRPSESVPQWIVRVLHTRVSATVRVRDILLAVIFVLLHIGFFVIWQDDCLADKMASDVWQAGLRAAATTFGYMATTSSLLLVLPATRNSLLGLLLGIEFDEAILFHRWISRWTLLLLVFHGGLYIPIWVDDPLLFDVRTTLPKFHWAVTAAVVSLFMFVTSVSYIRRRHFQFFHWSHFAFFLYFVAGSFHSFIMFRLTMVTLGLYVIDRLLRFFWGLWPRRCKLNDPLEGAIVHVVFSKHRLANYAVGNYVFLNFPQISFWEWHPFTLSSGPHDEYNEVHIKSLGDFTSKLYARAQQAASLKQKLWLRVDGPYGKFSLNHNRYPVVVLVAGGVGVTPSIACLKDIYRIRMSVVARVDHARQSFCKHVYFVWSAPQANNYYWFHDVFADCLQRHRDDPTYPQLHLYCHLTRVPELPANMPDHVYKGRPDLMSILRIVCNERTAELQHNQGAVFACGPTPLVSAAWAAAQGAAKLHSTLRLAFHQETFDF